MKTKNKITIAWISIIAWITLFFSFGIIQAKKITNLKKDLLIARAEASQKTEIEIVKEKLVKNKEKVPNLKKAKEKAHTLYETGVWYGRCLELLWELELKWLDHELECREYEGEDTYEFLKKFSSYNINKTRKELGL